MSYAPIRRGLLEHLPAMGPYATAAYLWLHLRAEPFGERAGEVRCTARELAAGTGMGRTAAAAALGHLQPRYIRLLAAGHYRIERFVRSADTPPVRQADNLSAQRTPCPPGGRHIGKRKETETNADPPPTPSTPAIAAPLAAATAAAGDQTLAPTTASPAAPAPAGDAASSTPRAAYTRRAAVRALDPPQESPHDQPADPPQLAPPGQAPRHAPAPQPRPAPAVRTARRPDPRHAPLAAAIRSGYAARNAGREAPWDGRAARRLAELLASVPAWPLADLQRCLDHRWASDRNHAEAPVHWVGSLADYRDGPLDRYNRPRAAASSAPLSAAIGAHPPGEPPAAAARLPRIAPGGDTRARVLWLDALDATRRLIPEAQHRRLLGASRGDAFDRDGCLTVASLDSLPPHLVEAAVAATSRRGVTSIRVVAGEAEPAPHTDARVAPSAAAPHPAPTEPRP